MKMESVIWYWEYIEVLINIPPGVIEIRKETAYQKNYKTKVLVIYYVLLQNKLVDYEFVNEKLWNWGYTKYISFKEIDSNLRLGIFHTNNIRNIEGKFEVLENISIIDLVKIKKER